MKHGLLAREIAFASSDEHVSYREYTKLLAELRKHFQPLGVMEDFLVQKIATCFWGQKMALRAMVGEASKQRKTAKQPSADAKPSQQDIVSLWLSMMLERERRRKDGSHNTSLTLTEGQIIKQVRKNLVGVLILRIYLREIRDECKRSGAVSKANRDLLRDCCGYDADLILSPLGYDATNSPEQVAEFLEKLEREDLSLQLLASSLVEEDRLDSQRFSIPDVRSDLLVRYDAHYSRELYRALSELERLQRKRSGEMVPPPIKVDVGGG